ncbi:Sporulation-like domain containing protein [Burkholderiales bacterium]|jgi:cell division protein FtsN
MANARNPDNPRQAGPAGSGGSIVSFSAGVAVGLIVAAAVAAYITLTPPPFEDRGLRKPEPPVAAKKSSSEPSAAPEPAEPPPPPPEAVAPPPPPPLADPKGAPLAEPPGTTYFLQVAAYRSVDEADQMRARLAILGFEASVSQVRRDSTVFHRVRLGPFSDFEVLNRTKVGLSENGLESTVVRVLPAQ